MDTRLSEFIDALQRTDDLDALRELFTGFIGDLGMSVFTYAALRTPAAGEDEGADMLVTNYPLSWREFYDGEQMIHVDPVIARASQSVVPVIWSELMTEPELRTDQKTFMHEARNHGLIQGVTVPIHARDGFALLSCASDLPDSEFVSALPMLRHALHIGALYYHERATRLREQVRGHGSVQLSKRERDVLLWAARGKTAWETSEILHISEHTVKQYLKSSMDKLGVSSKPQAVVRAIMLYLIFP